MAIVQLISKSEIVSIAINEANFETTFIKDSIINLSNLKYVKPLLGEDLYYQILVEALASSFTPENQALVDDYIKPILAYYIKAEILPDVFARVSTAGLIMTTDEYGSNIGYKDRNDLIEATKNHAENLSELLIEFINETQDNDPTAYLLYGSGSTTITKLNKGGLIL